VEEFAKKRSMPTLGHGFFNLRVNNFEETQCTTVEEFLSVMARTPVFDRLSSFQRWEGKGDKQVRVDIDVTNNTVKAAVEAKDIDLVNAAHAYLSSEFNLRNPEIPRSDNSRALHPQPTIFLGRHFDCQRSPKVHHLWSLQSAPPIWDKTSS